MKYSFMLAIICVLLFSCKEKKADNDLTKMNLKEKVKTLTERDYYLDTTGTKKGKVLRWTYTYTFNNQGFITEKTQMDDKGELTVKYTYRYDTTDHLIEEKVIGDELISTSTYRYDSMGYKMICTVKPADTSAIYNIYTYTFNSKKLLIKKTMSTDNSIAANQDKSAFSWQYEETYTYNKDKQKVKCRHIDYDSFAQTTIYNYDEQGNCISEKTNNAKPHVVINTSRKFDKKGNEIELISYESDGSVHAHIKHEYKSYDKQGNWLIRSTHWKDLGTTIVERDISYFSK